MKPAVEGRRCLLSDFVVACGKKGLRPLPLAVETGAMAGRERSHFIEEEEFRPARAAIPSVATHGFTSPSLEIEYADDPGGVGPAPIVQRPGIRVVEYAAVAGEQPARIDRMDATERIDTVLQWHDA